MQAKSVETLPRLTLCFLQANWALLTQSVFNIGLSCTLGVHHMLNNNLRHQFIETYLRYGEKSEAYQNLKRSLYQQGASKMDIIELVITARLYGNLDNFYRKNPQM